MNPTGSGRRLTLYQVAEELSRRLSSIFPRDGGADLSTVEPGSSRKIHTGAMLQFFEYFHGDNGDNGAGLGASHQRGWTGIVARTLHLFATTSADEVLEKAKDAVATEGSGRVAVATP